MQRLVRLFAALSVAAIVGSTNRAYAFQSTPLNYSPGQSARAEAVKKLADKWGKRLRASRYMVNDTCVTLKGYPGWETFSLDSCNYTMKGIKASVIMLNPSAEQIARWIVDACYEAGHPEPIYMDRLFAHVICQSGGQFPVAGIVLEDMDGNGRPNNYCFRNGVTVAIKGLFTDSISTSGGKKARNSFPEKQATEKEIQKCYKGEVEKVWKARIQSTHREDYQKSGGTLNVKGLAWMDVVKTLYQQAWEKDRNELMIAWAKQHLTSPVTGKSDTCVFCLLQPEKCHKRGCYDPQPGHPTQAEKTSFVQEIGAYAKEVEGLYHVPAAALVAMACVEGGFGWTQIALNANNIYGWKYYSEKTAEGRKKWVLACQPPEDDNNRYIKFQNRKEAVLFVAKKLSVLSHYKAAAQTYKQDLASGVDVVTAVNRWVDGIADAGYNQKPERYKTTLKRVMNNYLSPAQAKSEADNLYQFSEK